MRVGSSIPFWELCINWGVELDVGKFKRVSHYKPST